MILLPFFKQETPDDCGPACLQMVFEYFGNKKTQKELSVRLGAGPDIWVSNEELEAVAQESGFHTKSSTGATLEDLKKCIDTGVPTIINYIDPDNHEGHFAVVVGYTNDFLVLNDPWYGKDFPLSYAYLDDNWRSYEGDRNRWFLAVWK